MPDQLNVLPIPIDVDHIWDWWLELGRTRSTGMDASHITYTEVESWSRLLQLNVSKFEVRCLMALDTVFINCQREAQANKAASK